MKKLYLLLLVLLLAPVASAANFHIVSWITTNSDGPVCDLNNPTVSFTIADGQSKNYCGYVTPFNNEGYLITTQVINQETGASASKSEYITDGTQFPEVTIPSSLYNGPGTYQVRVTVDGDLTLPITRTMTLIVTGQNNPPLLAAIGDKYVREGEQLSFTLSATDPDGDALFYTMQNNPSWITLNGNQVSINPPAGSAGSYAVTFIVSDGTITDAETITIFVLPAQQNNAPVLEPIGDKQVDEGATLSFQVSATDADGDALTYTASGVPAFATFTGQTFTAQPGFFDAGTYTITFTVSDGKATDSETITLSVNNVNRAPVFTPLSDRYVVAGNQITFSVLATDADGDALTYAALNLPSWASFDAQTRTFTGTPQESDVGDYSVTFTVNDGLASSNLIVPIHVLSSGSGSNNPQVSGLNIFEDAAFSQIATQFNRGETMYISFMLTNNGALTQDAVDALRVQFEGGAVATATHISNNNGIYYYAVDVPLVDAALGDVHIIEIDAFNQTMQQPIQLPILNNVPVMDKLALDAQFNQTLADQYIFDLALFASDVEDANNLNWFVSGYDTDVITVDISGTLATILVQGDGATQIFFQVFDSEGDRDTHTVQVRTNTSQDHIFQCSDGIDNDNDGLVDLSDPDCDGGNDDSEHTLAQCNDGVDNDGDGLVDLADPDCDHLTDNDESSQIECSDGIDNDQDGLVDLADPDCSSSTDDSEEPTVLSQCNDGIDNDGDGFTDIYDEDCSSFGDDSETPEEIPVSQEPAHDLRGHDALYITSTALISDLNKDEVLVAISLENELGFDLEDVDVTAYIDGIDWKKSGKFDLDDGDQTTIRVRFDSRDLTPGVYDLGIIVQNDDIRRVVWRDLRVQG